MQPISTKRHPQTTLSISPRTLKEAEESKPRVRLKLQEFMMKHQKNQAREQDALRSDSLVEQLVLLN